MSAFNVDCPQCKQRLKLPAALHGVAVVCPMCSTRIQAPQPQPASSPPPLPPDAALAPMHVAMTPRNSGLAIASLVLGVIGLITGAGGLLFGIPAVVCGHVARSKIRNSAGAITGRGVAAAGLATGYVAIVFGVGVLASWLVPAIQREGQTGQMVSTLEKGKLIHHIQYEMALDLLESQDWPQSGKFSTSTEYFTSLVTSSGGNAQGYSIFAAPGITPCNGTNDAMFKAENNAWCVVADLRDTDPDDTPFLFTRNLRIPGLAAFKQGGRAWLSDDPPFGRTGVLVVAKGGAARVLKPEELAKHFNPSGAANRVLRP